MYPVSWLINTPTKQHTTYLEKYVRSLRTCFVGVFIRHDTGYEKGNRVSRECLRTYVRTVRAYKVYKILYCVSHIGSTYFASTYSYSRTVRTYVRILLVIPVPTNTEHVVRTYVRT